MAKRRAAHQIVKIPSGFSGNDADSSDEEIIEERAAPEVLAQRKIAVPRARLNRPAPSGSSSSSNAFTGLGKPSVQPSNPFSGLSGASTSSSAPANPFGGLRKPANTFGKSETTADVHNKLELRTRGLNASFTAQISRANNESPFEDWTKMCQKYIAYAASLKKDNEKQIKTEKSEKVEKTEPHTATPQITSTGFKFGYGSSSSTSFQFGDKQVSIQAPSHSAKPSGSFVFNPNGQGEIKATPFPSSSALSEEDEDTKPVPTGPAKPVFSFGNAEKPVEKPAFSFGKPAEKSVEKPAFSFGKPAEDEPAFSFGKPAEPEKPAFSFGKPAAEEKPAAAKPTHKPAFSFSQSADSTDNSTFSFGKPADSNDKPAFSFGKPAESNDKPAFSFGKPAESAEKPTFSFGKPAESNDKPSFSFGKPAESSDKSVFSFGKPAEEKPKFQFDGSDPKTEFSFGSGVNPFGNNTPSATPAPPAAQNNTAQSSVQEEGEPSEEQNIPQIDLGGPGPGEEDEESVYEKKAKVFELINGEYKSLGVGQLRVLVHKESKKARALLRAEGSGRVLLNVPVRKAFNYTVVGKGQVKVMDVKPGNDKPTVYLLRVKTEANGEELKDALESNKS